ncbi:MAG TPA: IPT/TIG domain-containing protein, partial [Bryobacteraceae bacterium]|nr:IPT/TIG domain-containing protein [Bryobacteraceae bacterium]
MSYLLYPLSFLFLVAGVLSQSLSAQTLACNAAAQPPLVSSEGLAERTGDIVLTCTGGAPNAQITGNLTLFTSENITNRVAAGVVSGVVFTQDNGSGPMAINTPGVLNAPGTLVYNGVSFTLSSMGTVTLRIADLRLDANQTIALANAQIAVLLSFSSNSTPVAFSNTQVIVGDAQRGLYDAFSSKILCSQSGSPLAPNPASFANFIATRSSFNSTRLTEGFAAAFDPLSGFQGLNADTGTRFIVKYSGFPSGARLFVPTVVAGSDATQPTSGGDLGLPVSGGRYTPVAGSGSLLLSLVQFANPDGSGGTRLYTPGAPGSGMVSFDGVTEISLASGAGFAVYEVVDANPFVQESAQFPTFLALAPGVVSGPPVETSETVSFAPVSTVGTATASDPIPRFVALTPGSDCTLVGDCGASYFPALNVLESSVMVSAQSGSAGAAAFIEIQNSSGGVLEWNASVTYQSGANWLSVSPSSGANNATIQLIAKPGSLAAGTYQATLTIDAGPIAGTRQIPVTFTVTPAAAPTPTITSVVNAATLAAGPLTPGSLATVMGTLFSATGLSVTFDGTPAQILFSNSTQINLLVPAALQGKSTSQMIVSANGLSSAPQTVALAAFAPGIFP